MKILIAVLLASIFSMVVDAERYSIVEDVTEDSHRPRKLYNGYNDPNYYVRYGYDECIRELKQEKEGVTQA